MKIERPERTAMLGGEPLATSLCTIVRGASGFVFAQGMAGANLDTGEIPEGLEAQLKLTWENIRQILENAGSSLDNVCHIWYHMVASSPREVNSILTPLVVRVTDEYFREHSSLPHRAPGTGIGTTGLGYPEFLIEITVIAALP